MQGIILIEEESQLLIRSYIGEHLVAAEPKKAQYFFLT